MRFASKADDKFDAIPWTADGGLPGLDGLAGWIACEILGSSTAAITSCWL